MKKQYISPLVEELPMESLNIMKTSTETPIDPSPAPRRPTDLF